jgi:hypothetical protein
MVCLGIADSGDYFVMAGLDPAIHVFCMVEVKTWDTPLAAFAKLRRPTDQAPAKP